MSEDESISGSDEFLFALVENKVETQERPAGKGFPPTLEEYEPSDNEKEWIDKPLRDQVEKTASVLKAKTMKGKEDQVFYIIGANTRPAGYEMDQILKKLNAEIISYYDNEHTKILLVATSVALDTMIEKSVPKYLQKYVRMIRPLSLDDQIPESLKKTWGTQSKMVIINIMPNIGKDKQTEYVNQTKNFLNQNNREVFEEALTEDGLVFTELDFNTVEKLLNNSTFVYRIQSVPQGIAESIKTRKIATRAVPLSLEPPESDKKNLPIVTVMDTGLNPIIPLNDLIEQRDSHGYATPDDDYPNSGHGTPVACLATFGDGIGKPRSRLISYKIWSNTENRDSFQGMLNGIKKFRDRSRIFTTSIGFPEASLHETYIIDRMIQKENICFVCSAGNIETKDIFSDINSGKQYPHYLHEHSVMSPADAISSLAVGSLVKNKSSRGRLPTSIAPEGSVSPYSCCGTKNTSLFDCIKPDMVEHGHNLLLQKSTVTTHGLSGISSYTKDGKQTYELFGTSFSSPLVSRKIAEIEAKYGAKIKNAETLKSISFVSCISNSSTCSGHGLPISFTGCDIDHALFLAEGEIMLSDKTEKGKQTVYSNEIAIKVPNSSIGTITLCLVHSDDYRWEQIPTLNTYMLVEARKTGSDSLVMPDNIADLNKKTNVKILTYSFEKKSMEATWRFNIIPELTKKIPLKYRKQTTVRYGCAILLSRKKEEFGKSSVTEQIKASRKYEKI